MLKVEKNDNFSVLIKFIDKLIESNITPASNVINKNLISLFYENGNPTLKNLISKLFFL